MAQNYKREGCVLNYVVPASTTITSGQVVVCGSLIGVAKKSGTTGDIVPVQLEGVWELPKTQPQVWTQGQTLYWDPATSKVTNVAGSLAVIGYADVAAVSAATVGDVLLLRS